MSRNTTGQFDSVYRQKHVNITSTDKCLGIKGLECELEKTKLSLCYELNNMLRKSMLGGMEIYFESF
jgi:hypothetical protein